MNLKIYKNKADFQGVYLKEHILLEKIQRTEDTVNYPKEQPAFPQLDYHLYNLDENIQIEVASGMKKYDLGQIYFLPCACDYIYFTTYSVNSNGSYRIYLMRFLEKEDSIEEVYSMDFPDAASFCDIRLSFFIFNDSYLLIQKESDSKKPDVCRFSYEVIFYSVKEKKALDVKDENLTMNGITCMVQLQDNLCLIKTGFSLLQDDRFYRLNEREVSVEGIYVINREQLVSDLVLQKENVLGKSIDQTYFDATIPYAMELENYVVYSKVKKETKEEEILFYDYKNDVTYSCIYPGTFDTYPSAKPYVLGGKPCVRLDKKKYIEFLDVVTNQPVLKLDTQEHLEAILHDFVLTEKRNHSLFFHKPQSKVKVYKYPAMALLHEEKGQFQCAISPKEEELFLFTKNRK